MNIAHQYLSPETLVSIINDLVDQVQKVHEAARQAKREHQVELDEANSRLISREAAHQRQHERAALTLNEIQGIQNDNRVLRDRLAQVNALAQQYAGHLLVWMDLIGAGRMDEAVQVFPEDILQKINGTNTIGAIKTIRSIVPIGLKEAKDVVDALRDSGKWIPTVTGLAP